MQQQTKAAILGTGQSAANNGITAAAKATATDRSTRQHPLSVNGRGGIVARI